MKCFCSCLPGLENLLFNELKSFGIADLALKNGGVEFGKKDIHKALKSGLTSHVLDRVAIMRCRALGELQRKCDQIKWNEVLEGKSVAKIDVTCRKSRLVHTGAVEERIRNAMKKDKVVVSASSGELRVLARFENDELTVSVEKQSPKNRGYRTEPGSGGKAPLREDLARALVLASGWEPESEVLFDPFCGSGTILIEALLSIENRSHLSVAGCDRDEGIIDKAKGNAKRAGCEGILFSNQTFTKHEWFERSETFPKKGLIITNPPYGVRLKSASDVGKLYTTLGKKFKELGSGWRMMILCNNENLVKCTNLNFEKKFETKNGGIRVSAFLTKS